MRHTIITCDSCRRDITNDLEGAIEHASIQIVMGGVQAASLTNLDLCRECWDDSRARAAGVLPHILRLGCATCDECARGFRPVDGDCEKGHLAKPAGTSSELRDECGHGATMPLGKSGITTRCWCYHCGAMGTYKDGQVGPMTWVHPNPGALTWEEVPVPY